MSPVDRPLPIPGVAPAPLPSHSLVTGACPVCEAGVLWAVDRRDKLDGSAWHAPLDPVIVESSDREDGLVRVLVSSTGQAAVIDPQIHRLHRCPREAVDAVLHKIGGLGYYTADILGITCPVRSCGSAPGMLCLSQRREALPRPHGSRVVASRGEELDLPLP